ncbi:hypothetical protein, partial [uncultured Imperialibacter sp.]|uniref:hypothetical protein n=1 Tax=uncultured Imperialibacter sp. TaxID=1672639 RepID=UPI0030DBF3AA
EHLTVNQRVLGSSPRGGAEVKKAIRDDGFFVFILFENQYRIKWKIRSSKVEHLLVLDQAENLGSKTQKNIILFND